MRNTIHELTFLYCKTYRNNSLMLMMQHQMQSQKQSMKIIDI
jgi:hypothetical protein